MKKKLILLCICVFVCILSCYSFISCTNTLSHSEYTTISYFNTSTYFQAIYTSDIKKADVDDCWSSVRAKLGEIEDNISVYKQESDIYAFNQSSGDEWIEISKTTYDVLSDAISIFELTDGAFNPTVYPLCDLWGFTYRFTLSNYISTCNYDRNDYKSVLPTSTYIDGFTVITNFADVNLSKENEKYYVYKPDCSVLIDGVTYYMEIDLGGIGKGYACDEAQKIISSFGIKYGYLSVGTSSISLMEKSDSNPDWNLKLNHPRKADNYYLTVQTNTNRVSTSGDYENYYEIDGVRYCHIIDSKTGYPISNGMVTVSVLNDSAAHADALTTALCVMGKDKAIDFIKANQIQSAFVYYDDINDQYELYTNLSSYSLNDSSFVIKVIE